MKHILACFAFWAFIATISVQATAEFVTYNIAEGPISISIPSYLTVWTRETVKDSTDEYIIGVTPEELLKRMEEDNLYLCVGLDEYEIAVFIEDIGDGDMNDFSESELNHLRQDLADSIKQSLRAEILSSDFYPHSQEIFIRNRFKVANAFRFEYHLQYYTACNGKTVSINMITYEGTLDDDREALMKGIVDSVSFIDYPQRNYSFDPNSMDTTFSH